MNSENLNSLAQHILQLAQQNGASAAETTISREKGLTVTVRLAAVETIEHHQDKGVTITVYFGQRAGSASSSDLSEAALRQAVEKACYIARYTNEDPAAGLADKALLAYDYDPIPLYFPWAIMPEQAIEMATRCEDMARQYDKRISNSEGATINSGESQLIYANSLDFVGTMATSRHSISCSLIATAKGEMQRDYEYTTARDAADLLPLQEIAQRVAKKTVQRLGARSVKTQKAPVIFAAPMAKSVLGNFVSAISGGNLYRKSSFLLDHLGKTVFPAFITLDQRPHLEKAFGSTPFDNDGVKTTDRVFVKDGVLQSYVLSSYSARQLKLQTTGNAGGTHNLFINATHDSLETLLKSMGTGLLVTELIGQGVNIMTGDYSRGAFGYWVEGGEIQYPVHEITIAGNLKDMLLNIRGVGNDIDHRGNIHTGSILIDSLMIAGQ